MERKDLSGFVLRNVADSWFLLDLNHPELPYKTPLRMNETGAYIYKKYEEGLSLSEIASALSADTGVSEEDVHKDVKDFSEELKAYGVPLTDEKGFK